jgi:RNA methyltransferase, TrmH family
MPAQAITSVHNPRVKDAIKLRDSRQRHNQGRFLIDGARETLQAIAGRVQFVEAFVCAPLCTSSDARRAVEQLRKIGVPNWDVPPEVFEKMAFGERREGVLVVAETPRRDLAGIEVRDDAPIAVVEAVEKPGNLGAVLRTADAAGIAAVIAADSRTDLYNPNSIRASLGTVFTSQVCQATTDETLGWLRARGYLIFAARPNAARDYSEVDFRQKCAIVLGSEASGLSAAWEAPDVIGIKLPMLGHADSLNVSTTAAALFYEALRQRRQLG